MSTSIKLSVALVGTFVIVVVAALLLSSRSDTSGSGSASAADDSATTSVRDDSNVLSAAPDGKVTLVEFLDFECEACGAAYPVVEELRSTYEGRVTFAARYFPIPSHANAMNAAVAVQSAANQGKFEAMYQKMYETQSTWGESQESKAALFRTFAEDLGLDMARFDADVDDPATQKRVERDRDDGIKLGVQGTPTFFLNGKKIEPQSQADFARLIDEALAATQ